MRNRWLKKFSLAMVLVLGSVSVLHNGTLFAVEAIPGSDQPTVQAGSQLFITYVHASQRMELWSENVLLIAKASKDAEILHKFGLLSADEVQLLSDRKLAAQEELKKLKLQSTTAYMDLVSRYGGVPNKAAEMSTIELTLDKGTVDLLKQAELLEKKASIEAASADLQVKSGTLDSGSALNKQEAYLQARLNTLDAKFAYYQSIVSAYMAAYGSAMPLTVFLEAIDQQGNQAQSKEWKGVIAQFGVPVIQAVPSEKRESGEVFVALRPYVEALHYEIEWDPIVSEVLLSNEYNKVKITVDQSMVVKNDQEIMLHSPPYLHQDTTYVPLSLLTDVLGIEVYWDDQAKQAIMIPQLIGEEG